MLVALASHVGVPAGVLAAVSAHGKAVEDCSNAQVPATQVGAQDAVPGSWLLWASLTFAAIWKMKQDGRCLSVTLGLLINTPSKIFLWKYRVCFHMNL